MTEATNDLWQSLPVPAIMFNAGDLIVDANPSAESFLNASLRQVQGKPVFDVLAIDAPVDEQARRARDDQTPLFMNNVDVGTGLGAPVNCNIQIGPLQDHPGHLLMLLQPQVLADRLGRAMPVKSAAKSAIGMAEMLAHEIKNPLAGITGAAQLLSMNLGADDQELTDLIVSESRRILALLAQVEHFGNLRPPDCAAVNIHDLLDRKVHEPLFGDEIIWSESDPLPFSSGDAANDTQVNTLIEFAGRVHELFGNLSGGSFVSWDGAGGTRSSSEPIVYQTCSRTITASPSGFTT